MAGASGTATLDFGAWPGTTDTSIVVTGQTGITTSALVECWIFPSGTTDHSADEHIVDPPRVYAGNIVAGSGFTIYGLSEDDQIETQRITRYRDNVSGADSGTFIYGKWTVAWVWDIGSTGTLPATRTLLPADTTYYFRSDGSDSNTGLVNSAGGAFATIQKAINVALGLDLNGHTVTIQGGLAGTYAAFSVTAPFVGGLVNIIGDNTTPSNYVITGTNPCINVRNFGVQMGVAGFKLTQAGGAGIIVQSSAQVIINGNMEWGTLDAALQIASNSSCIFDGTGTAYTISGSMTQFVYCTQHSLCAINGSPTFTLTGTPNFSFFANIQDASYFESRSGSVTYSGAATGTRYFVNMNSVIETFGGGATYLPGNVNGAGSDGTTTGKYN